MTFSRLIAFALGFQLMAITPAAAADVQVSDLLCNDRDPCQLVSLRPAGTDVKGNSLYVAALSLGHFDDNDEQIEQWLVRKQGGQWEAVRKLVSHLANKPENGIDYIAKDIESAVQIGTGTITLNVRRGSMMWTQYHVVFRIDPWQPMFERITGRGGIYGKRIKDAWDWSNFRGIGTIEGDSTPTRVANPTTDKEREQAMNYQDQIDSGNRPMPTAKSWHFGSFQRCQRVNCPIVSISVDTFLWRDTLLGNCALTLDPQNAYLLSGHQAGEMDFYLRASRDSIRRKVPSWDMIC